MGLKKDCIKMHRNCMGLKGILVQGFSRIAQDYIGLHGFLRELHAISKDFKGLERDYMGLEEILQKCI